MTGPASDTAGGAGPLRAWLPKTDASAAETGFAS